MIILILLGRRAQAMLKKCLLRRSKDTKLEGKPILQLPPKTIELVELEFSPEEREVCIDLVAFGEISTKLASIFFWQIYNKVEVRQQQKMSKFLKSGTVMKKCVFT